MKNTGNITSRQSFSFIDCHMLPEVNMGINERKERERERRRNDIVDAAERVFFSSKDVESATMEDVAEEAELSKGTLYLYFKNKNELLHAIVARAMELLLKLFRKAVSTKGSGLDKIAALGESYSKFYKTSPDYFDIMLHREKQVFNPESIDRSPNIKRCEELGDEIFKVMGDTVRLGMEDGSIRRDLDPYLLSVVMWGHSSGILNLVRTKQPYFEGKLNVSGEDLIKYSRKLTRIYLENPQHNTDKNE